MDQSIDAETLASQLEQLALNEQQRQGILPSPRQLVAVGRILFRIPSEDGSDLFFAYQHLVDSIPDSHWDYVSSCFQKAAKTLTAAGHDLNDLMAALESWCGLLTHAPKLCQILYSKEWIATLSMIYDTLVVKNATISQKQILLATLSSLVLDGLFLPSSSSLSSTKESLQEQVLEAIQAMEQYSTECLADLQVWQNQKEPFRRTLASEIRNYNTTNPTENLEQWEYILDMLQSVQQRDTPTLPIGMTSSTTSQPSSTTTTSSAVVSKPVSAADELERRIQQVKQILPDYGEGFIETALSLYQGNVETTIATLLSEDSPSYPSALRVLDKSLPRRRKQRSDEEAAEAAQARQLVKERVAMEQKQKEAQYKALLYVQKQDEAQEVDASIPLRNEYDDDYDDQYDDIDIKLGGADDGMYDFEQVKLYNKFVRTEEADDSFWQENRNTNRVPSGNNKNKKNNNNQNQSQNKDDETEDGPSKQYRGPDKIKGGRIIGPDGKVVRKQGGGKNPIPNNHNNANANTIPTGPAKPTNGDAKGSTNGDAKGGNPTSSANSDAAKNNPRTKPKAQNRINRQRDKKQRAQGTFGVQD